MTRTNWIAEVRSWVGTPFKWQGRVKGSGTDCWGLIVASSWACGYIPATWDVKHYNRRTNLVELAEQHLPQWFDNVPVDSLQPGDVVTFHGSSGLIHMGVLYEHAAGFGIVHSEDWLSIVEHRLSDTQREQIANVWRPRYE